MMLTEQIKKIRVTKEETEVMRALFAKAINDAYYTEKAQFTSEELGRISILINLFFDETFEIVEEGN